MTPRVALLGLLLSLSLTAAAQLPRNEVSLSGGWTELASVGGARQIGAGYTHYWSDNVATQFGAFDADKLRDVHALVEFHVLRDRVVSPWFGVGGAHLTFDNGFASRSKTTGIIGAGLDFTVTRRLALGAEVHYSDFVLDKGQRYEENINPVTFGGAVRWRF